MKPMMVFGMLYSDLVGPSAEDMYTGESQSIGESVLTHDEFFGHEVADLETHSVIGMYGISPKVKCREGVCGAS